MTDLNHAEIYERSADFADQILNAFPQIRKDIVDLLDENERLRGREQELWDRESLAMQQRNAAEEQVRELTKRFDVLHGNAVRWHAGRTAARAAIDRVRALDAADAATTSRDYGRGYAQALRDVNDALGKTDG